MAYKITYYSNVKNGKLQANISALIKRDLSNFNNKRVEIHIQRLKSKRSDAQNRYLHALFTIFKNALNDLGNEFTMEEVKELCKCKFALMDVVNEKTGECIGQRIKGTHEMNKLEMADFIESIIRYGADVFHIELPYPNENFELTFDNPPTAIS